MPPTLYMIDGHALAYRTYFALTRGSSTAFTTREGEPTAGVYGFTSVLLRILEQEHPDYLVVVFDTGRTFRDDLFPEYKGTREKMPDDLVTQMVRVRQIVDAFDIPRLEMEGYEADDVLGSVARQAVEDGLTVKIITGDRDLLQLVNDRVIVNLPGRSLADARDYLPDDVVEYLGIPPRQVVDYKALVGDKSDNIPGVTGVGDKTAISLLQEYDTLDNIYAHLDDLSKSVRKKLEAGRENAYLSQKLATIVQDLKVPFKLERARPDHIHPAKVEALFRELEFRALMGRFTALMEAYGKQVSAQGQQLPLFESRAEFLEAKKEDHVERGAILVDSSETLQELVKQLEAAEMIAFDTETTSTDQMQAELVGISLAVKPGQGYYIPVGHRSGQQLPITAVLDAIRGPMTNPAIPKAGHNLKYDFILLARYGLRVSPLRFELNDRRMADQSSFPQSGLEKPGLGKAGRADDPD